MVTKLQLQRRNSNQEKTPRVVIDKSSKVVQEVTDQREVVEDHKGQSDTTTLTSNKFNQEETINQEAKTEAVSEVAEEEHPSEREVNSELTEIEETTVIIATTTEDHNNKEEVVQETIWT